MSKEDTGFVAVHHYSDLYHGRHTRVFSEEVHGDGYKKLAEEFSKTHTPISKAHNVKVVIEPITEKDAKEYEAENTQKENDRMMTIYKQKGWVDDQGNVSAPTILRPSDFNQ